MHMTFPSPEPPLPTPEAGLRMYTQLSITNSCSVRRVFYPVALDERCTISTENLKETFSCALKYEHTSLGSFLKASALEEAEGIKPGSDREAPSCVAEVLTLL